MRIHLSRKVPCIAKERDVPIEELLAELDKEEVRVPTVHTCDLCNKTLGSSQAKYTHKRFYCPERKKVETDQVPVQETGSIADESLVALVQKMQKDYERDSSALRKRIDALELELQASKMRKDESFYQKLLEGHLGGTHKRLSIGETDVTTDDCHAELKRWDCWKEALGQLLSYKCADEKEKLHVYFFGKYGRKKEAIDVLKKFGIAVYEFEVVENGYKVHCLSDERVAMVYKDWEHKECDG